MIISFGWTLHVLLTGRKTVTRRCWQEAYARRFVVGSVHQAWSKGPHRGGQHVADIQIVDIRREPLVLFKEPDYAKAELALEGGLWNSAEEFVKLFRCEEPYRVQFRIVRKVVPKVP
jgi:hypothetical protein